MMGAGLYEARLEVLYKSLARMEEITVDDKELDDIIRSEAKNHKMKPKQLRKQMSKNGALEMLEYNLLTEKLNKLLLEKADVKYVAPGSKKEETKSKPKAKKSEKSDDTKEEKPKAKKETKAKKEEKTEDKPAKSKAKSKSASKAKSKPKAESKSKAKTSKSAKPKATKKTTKKASKKKAK